MVRLQMVEIEEISKESTGGEAESTLKMSEEDDPLASACVGHDLGAGSAPLNLGRHLPGADQGLDSARGHLALQQDRALVTLCYVTTAPKECY